MIFTHPAGIFLESDIQDPMQLVFNPPMQPNGSQHPFGRNERTANKIPSFLGDGLANVSLTGYRDNTVEIFPFRMPFLQPVYVSADVAAPNFDAAMTFINSGGYFP